MTNTACSCQKPESKRLSLTLKSSDEQKGFALAQCVSCQLIRTDPEPTQEQLGKAYGKGYYVSREAKFNPLIEWWTRYSGKNRARRLLRIHGARSGSLQILDIGCGRGVLLNGFRNLGHQVLGIERAGSGFDQLDDIESIELQTLINRGQRFDIIVLWHVLEHLPRPLQTLKQCEQLLLPDGSLFIEVPNFGSWQARVFGDKWFHLDVPRHLYHFSSNSLDSLIASARLRVCRRGTFSIDQNLFGLMQSLLNCLPGLPFNHLYSVLQSRLSLRTLWSLLLYTPLLIVIAPLAIAELLLSFIAGKGAVLSLHLKQKHHAQ